MTHFGSSANADRDFESEMTACRWAMGEADFFLGKVKEDMTGVCAMTGFRLFSSFFYKSKIFINFLPHAWRLA